MTRGRCQVRQNINVKHEIADHVVDLPTQSRAWYQFPGAQGGNYDQSQDGHAANF